MAFIANIFYKDARAALQWLEKAFGFETTLVVENLDGTIGHSEMSYAGGTFNLGGEWADWAKSPSSVGGANTQGMSVRIQSDIDGHYARARDAGAQIVQEPADQPYGARTYRAVDLDGHEWGFAQPTSEV